MGLMQTVVRGLAYSAGQPQALAASAAGVSSLSPPQLEASLAVSPGGLELATPWAAASPELTSILWEDIYGLKGRDAPLTREVALQVPALARARHLICGFGAKAQPVVFQGETRRPVQPRWISRTGTQLTPFHRMLWTLDDLFFSGWSLWKVERSSPTGPITGGATRVPVHRWHFDKYTGDVIADGEPLPAAQSLLIPGPHEGVLTFGRTAIIQAKELEDTATRVARNPAAYLELHYTGDMPLDDTAINAHRERWAEARRGEYGGVAWTGKDMEVKEHGAPQEHLVVEGRNAAAVNMARLASMPAAMLDATNAGASLTYETTTGRNAEFLDYGVDLYLDALAAVFSMDDVVPAGESTRMDTAQVRSLTPSPTGPTTED